MRVGTTRGGIAAPCCCFGCFGTTAGRNRPSCVGQFLGGACCGADAPVQQHPAAAASDTGRGALHIVDTVILLVLVTASWYGNGRATSRKDSQAGELCDHFK